MRADPEDTIRELHQEADRQYGRADLWKSLFWLAVIGIIILKIRACKLQRMLDDPDYRRAAEESYQRDLDTR